MRFNTCKKLLSFFAFYCLFSTAYSMQTQDSNSNGFPFTNDSVARVTNKGSFLEITNTDGSCYMVHAERDLTTNKVSANIMSKNGKNFQQIEIIGSDQNYVQSNFQAAFLNAVADDITQTRNTSGGNSFTSVHDAMSSHIDAEYDPSRHIPLINPNITTPIITNTPQTNQTTTSPTIPEEQIIAHIQNRQQAQTMQQQTHVANLHNLMHMPSSSPGLNRVPITRDNINFFDFDDQTKQRLRSAQSEYFAQKFRHNPTAAFTCYNLYQFPGFLEFLRSQPEIYENFVPELANNLNTRDKLFRSLHKFKKIGEHEKKYAHTFYNSHKDSHPLQDWANAQTKIINANKIEREKEEANRLHQQKEAQEAVKRNQTPSTDQPKPRNGQGPLRGCPNPEPSTNNPLPNTENGTPPNTTTTTPENNNTSNRTQESQAPETNFFDNAMDVATSATDNIFSMGTSVLDGIVNVGEGFVKLSEAAVGTMAKVIEPLAQATVQITKEAAIETTANIAGNLAVYATTGKLPTYMQSSQQNPIPMFGYEDPISQHIRQNPCDEAHDTFGIHQHHKEFLRLQQLGIPTKNIISPRASIISGSHAFDDIKQPFSESYDTCGMDRRHKEFMSQERSQSTNSTKKLKRKAEDTLIQSNQKKHHSDTGNVTLEQDKDELSQNEHSALHIDDPQLQERYVQRAAALQYMAKNPQATFDYSVTFDEHARRNENNPLGYLLRYCKGGSAFDRQIHQELCSSVNAMGQLARENPGNPHAQTLTPVVYHFSVVANEQPDQMIKAHLSDFCHYMMRASEGAVRVGKSMGRIAGIIGHNYVQHKAEFYKGILTCPMETLYTEFVQPLEVAGTFLGKAVVLACTNHTEFQKQAVLHCQQLIHATQTHPEQMLAAAISVLIPYGSKNLAQLKQIQPILNAINEQKKLATVCAIGHIADTSKKALEPIKTAVGKSVKTVQKLNLVEKIFDKVKTYEQARNKALSVLGDLGSNSQPYVGHLGIGMGKIVGRQSADRKARWRLDFDPIKGPHINIEDFRKGKGLNGIKIAIPFEGNMNTVESLLRHLNK